MGQSFMSAGRNVSVEVRFRGGVKLVELPSEVAVRIEYLCDV